MDLVIEYIRVKKSYESCLEYKIENTLICGSFQGLVDAYIELTIIEEMFSNLGGS